MTGSASLEDKLAAADAWVRGEWAFLRDLMSDAGAEGRPEAGPGLGYRIRGIRVVRVHPKRHHLALAFPATMRPQLEALGTASRAQRDAAWFTYAPWAGDREVMSALVERAVSIVVDGGPRSSDNGPQGRQDRAVGAAPRRPDSAQQDEADLSLVLAVLRAYDEHSRTTGSVPPVKVLRETLFWVWENPRLPQGGKRSKHLPHSPGARSSRAGGSTDGLVYEHVLPISLVVRELLADVPPDIAALRRRLDAAGDCVIVTSSENAALDAAGVRNAVPDGRDAWSRYAAIGLAREDFAPVEPLSAGVVPSARAETSRPQRRSTPPSSATV